MQCPRTPLQCPRSSLHDQDVLCLPKCPIGSLYAQEASCSALWAPVPPCNARNVHMPSVVPDIPYSARKGSLHDRWAPCMSEWFLVCQSGLLHARDAYCSGRALQWPRFSMQCQRGSLLCPRGHLSVIGAPFSAMKAPCSAREAPCGAQEPAAYLRGPLHSPKCSI